MRTSTNLLIKFSYIHISEAFNFVTIIRRSESIYTIRRSVAPPWWRRLWAHCFGPLPEEPRLRTIVPNHLVPPKTPKSQHPNGDRADNRWERVAGTTRIRRWIRTIDYPLRCTASSGYAQQSTRRWPSYLATYSSSSTAWPIYISSLSCCLIGYRR